MLSVVFLRTCPILGHRYFLRMVRRYREFALLFAGLREGFWQARISLGFFFAIIVKTKCLIPLSVILQHSAPYNSTSGKLLYNRMFGVSAYAFELSDDLKIDKSTS